MEVLGAYLCGVKQSMLDSSGQINKDLISHIVHVQQNTRDQTERLESSTCDTVISEPHRCLDSLRPTNKVPRWVDSTLNGFQLG